MNTINIKLNKEYKSLQEGFEWNNIPMFSIITGVNGVGKTHLVTKLRGSGSLPTSNRPATTTITITNKEGVKISLSQSQNPKNNNINALIDYYKNADKRKEKEIELTEKQDALRDRLNELLSVPTPNPNISSIHSSEIQNIQLQISQLDDSIKSLVSADYEYVIEKIKLKANKNIEDISEDDIRFYAYDLFSKIIEVDDLEKCILEYERAIVLNTYRHNKKKDTEAAEKENNKERIFQKINRLFKTYGFKDYIMSDPFESKDNENLLLGKNQNKTSRNNTPQKIAIRFEGKKGELIDYNSLSPGEQMIVKFTIWSMAKDSNGLQIDTLILDEPDAHLHPSMCQMMIEILSEIAKPKEEGGSGIRVIMTTHSPSTVAFAPEGSLFVMEKDDDGIRRISNASNSEAMSVLSSGIFTFDKAIDKFTLAASTVKNNILFVEGKSDVNHFEKAMSILGYDLDLEIIDMHDAGSLGNFIKSTPAKLFGNKKLIALFDNDNEGRLQIKNTVKESGVDAAVLLVSSEQCEDKSYVLTICSPQHVSEHCPVELLYPFNYLKDNQVLVLIKEHIYEQLYCTGSLTEKQIPIAEYEQQSTLRCFDVKKNVKNRFSEIVMTETDSSLFENFRPTLELIKRIIES